MTLSTKSSNHTTKVKFGFRILKNVDKEAKKPQGEGYDSS